jgi:Domain of unknown function (DUF1839)
MSFQAIGHLNPSTYVQHQLHRSEKTWPETNCYVDVWIEILHALGLDPLAGLSMVFAIDFEGDQWTFYKPPHEDLYALYGIDIQELNLWHSLLDHCSLQLQRGRLVLLETDAFYLPDTAGTDYRQKHTKTTVGIQHIDRDRQVMGYFHNASYFELKGEDFVRTFRVDLPLDPNHMPFLAEFVRIDQIRRLTPRDLSDYSRSLLRKHLARRPQKNPITSFAQSYDVAMTWLKQAGLATFHAHAFANLRQLGSAFEIAAYYVRWLESNQQLITTDVASHCDTISQTSKSLLLKSARVVNTGKPGDFAKSFDAMATAWDQITSTLDQVLKT